MTTSTTNKEMMEVVLPDENLMFYREGFDRPSIRREFAGVTALGRGERYVKQGNATYVHPDSDMPTGPTGTAESFGNVELVRELGKQVEMPRFTHGFTHELEDDEVDTSHLADSKQAIMELFDIQADLSFFQGVHDEQGNEIVPGIFDWLDGAIPTENVIDCTQWDTDMSELNGLPANIIKKVAYQNVTGEYVLNTWDAAVAKHNVWAMWNELGTFEGTTGSEKSQWQLVADNNDTGGVGINRAIKIPDSIGIPSPTDMSDRLSWDVDVIGDDEMYLLPNHGGDFYQLYEQGTPDHRGPLDKDGFRVRHEYKWRGGAAYGFSHRAGGLAPDTFKLTNVSALFN